VTRFVKTTVRGPFHDQCPRGFHTIIDFHVGTQYSCTWRETKLPTMDVVRVTTQKDYGIRGPCRLAKLGERITTTLNTIGKGEVNL
jgi:hypothetical protein